MNNTKISTTLRNTLQFSTEGSGTAVSSVSPILSSILMQPYALIIVLSVIIIGLLANMVFNISTVVLSMGIIIISYTIGIFVFEYGPTSNNDVERSFKERNLLLVFIAVGLSVIGCVYMVDTVQNLSSTVVSIGLIVLYAIVGRQLFKTIKEDVRVYSLNRTKLWAAIVRVPFVALLAYSVFVSVPTIATATGAVAIPLGTSIVYRIVTLFQATDVSERPSTEEVHQQTESINTDTDTDTNTDSGTPSSTQNESSSEKMPPVDTGAELQLDTSDGEKITIEDTKAQPSQLRERHEKAKELTESLDDSIEELNSTLYDEELGFYSITRVPYDQETLEPSTAGVIHSELGDLREYLTSLENKNSEVARCVRLEMFDVKQILAEFEEYVYK